MSEPLEVLMRVLLFIGGIVLIFAAFFAMIVAVLSEPKPKDD